MPTVSSAFTGPDGEFSISTYESGDGVPAGDYVLTFMWGQKEAFSGRYGGPDKLGNRNLVVNALQTLGFEVLPPEGEPGAVTKE